MNRIVGALGILTLVGLLAGFAAERGGAEEESVRQSVQYYIDGQAAGDGTIIARAFHPDAHMTGLRDGAISRVPISQYVTWFRGEPAADEAQRERWIESVDVVGDAAIAKVVLDYPGVRFTDWMSLLKVDGQWKIVHKNYTAQPK
ncbi:MAG: nuclear transport factor 2 family protein [Gemmatimonadota bacterium]